MKLTLTIISFCLFIVSFSQDILEIDITRFNKFKNIQLFNHSFLEYKLKGEHKYRINKMAAMQDSMIIFDNDSSITLSEIKAIKLRNSNHLIPLFGSFFVIGGAGVIIVDSFNKIINGQPKIVDERVALIGASLFVAGIIIKQLAIKRVRMNKHRTLRIIKLDFQNLNK